MGDYEQRPCPKSAAWWLAVGVDDTRATIATEGGIELRSEPLLRELQKQARLPHSCTQQSINNREIYFP